MGTRTVQKSEWNKFFNLVSKSIEGQKIEIEVSGLDFGSQIEADSVPFDGISYDAKSDYIFVHTPLLDHTIIHPSTVLVAEDDDTVIAISITDDQNIQILQFLPPIELNRKQRAEQESRL